MMKDSDAILEITEVRSDSKNLKRYARAKAVANGTDSHKSIFGKSAREKIVSQLLNKPVKIGLNHRNEIFNNVKSLLDDYISKSPDRVDDVKKVLAQLPTANFPIGKVSQLEILDDSTVDVVIEENDLLRNLGEDSAKYLDGAWRMVEEKYLNGVSLAFNKVVSHFEGDKLVIDDLNILGLDFVDRNSHPNTTVAEVFMRAAVADATPVGVKTMPETTPINVDEITQKIEQSLLAKQKQEQDQLKAQQEIDAKLKALENEKAALKAERDEAIELAKQAVQKAKEEREKVAYRTNPHFDAAKQVQEGSSNSEALAKLSKKDLFKLKYG